MHFWQIIIYCLTIVFILGFPKYYDYDVQVDLAPKIENSIFCNIEKSMYLQQSDLQDISCNRSKNLVGNEEVNQIYKSGIKHKPFNMFFIILNFSVCFYLLFNKRFSRKN